MPKPNLSYPHSHPHPLSKKHQNSLGTANFKIKSSAVLKVLAFHLISVNASAASKLSGFKPSSTLIDPSMRAYSSGKVSSLPVTVKAGAALRVLATPVAKAATRCISAAGWC